jgi:hypothetical protein
VFNEDEDGVLIACELKPLKVQIYVCCVFAVVVVVVHRERRG